MLESSEVRSQKLEVGSRKAADVVSKLILGTVQLGLNYGVNNSGGKVSEEESHRILKKAHAAGITNLDTAEAYGNAHEVIGSFHRANAGTAFNVITKIPAGEATVNIAAKLEGYLQQLHVEQLEGLMFHAFSTYQNHKHLLPELKKLKAGGLFNQLGVSVYTNDELKAVIEDADIDLVQLPFNLLDNTSLRGAFLREAKAKGKTIHTRSAFLQGLFFKDPADEHKIVKALRQQLIAIHTIAQEENVSVAELALSYCLAQPNIDNVLIGVDSVEQLTNNLQAANYSITKEAVEKIDSMQTQDVSLLNPSLWK